MTGRDLVSASLRLIGASAPGQSIPANEAVDGLAALNRMLDSWSNDSLMVYETTIEEFTLTAGKQNYSIGPSADFNTTRPIMVNLANLRVTTSTPEIDYALQLVNDEEWASIRVKGLSTELPQYIYFNQSFPNSSIDLYPIPAVAYKLILYSVKPLTRIASLDSEISLPPGYEEAMIYNLAMRLSPEYGRPVTQEVAIIASDAKAAIQRTNFLPVYLRSDEALVTSGMFDIRRGEYR